jgi:hypothetical protein
VVRVLERIAADLDNLGLVPNDPQADEESNQNDPQARDRRELAEPSREPKKLSHRERATSSNGAKSYLKREQSARHKVVIS